MAVSAAACWSDKDVKNEVCSALARFRGVAASSRWDDAIQDCVDLEPAGLGRVVKGEKRLVLRIKKIRAPAKSRDPEAPQDY